MTALEQFNEEVMKEFDRSIDPSNYEETEHGSLKEPNDSLLDATLYPESAHEISDDKIKEFITKTLAAHKELILKMVREKAEDSNGYGEFLDDLKTL